MNKISITHMNNRHNDQLRALTFYKQEINILKARLTEIAGKNTGKEVLREVEHFENQFIVQMDNINRLRHDIRKTVSEIGTQAESSKAGYVDSQLMNRHDYLEQSFSSEESVINGLRHEFNQFASVWM